jgi:hypothetical protein
MAASLRKKIQRRVGLVDKTGLVEPYMASEERDAVHILGPEVGSLGLYETRSMSGIFRALRLWRNVIRYERYEKSEGFWVALWGCCRDSLETLMIDRVLLLLLRHSLQTRAYALELCSG